MVMRHENEVMRLSTVSVICNVDRVKSVNKYNAR
jgi:hypothetical protein